MRNTVQAGSVPVTRPAGHRAGPRTLAAFPGGRRAKWVVLAVWVILLLVLGPLAGKINSVQKNDVSAWLPKDAESTQVVTEAKRFWPTDTTPTVAIYERPAGITSADLAKARADATAFQRIKDVTGKVQGPFPSRDGKALQTIVPIHLGTDGWAGISTAVGKMTSVNGQSASSGLSFHVTGPGGYAADSAKLFSSGGNAALMWTTVLVLIAILLFTYRGPVLFLPLITAGIALTAANAVVYLLAAHVGMTVNGESVFILTILVFGASTDYALLLIARYREELRRHEDRHVAMAAALQRSSPAIVASAATVAISLMLLLLATLNSTKGLGPACVIGILVGFLAMTTLMPALLVICGRWIFWPAVPLFGSPEPASTGRWARLGSSIAVRPRLIWIGTAVVLGVLALSVIGMKADGVPQNGQFTKPTQAVAGERIQNRHFPAGAGDPIYVVGSASRANQIKAALAGTAGVADVADPVVEGGSAFVSATFKDGPGSASALDTVKRARAAVHHIQGASAKLGGGSAVTLDVKNAAAHDSRVIIPMVLLVVFVILALLLRALAGALLLIATVVLSFGASLGVSVLMFGHVFHFAGIDPGFPLIVFVFLVALGVDYNIFLVTRIREEAEVHGTRRGALTGLAVTGGVITSAGAVLAGTFAALGSVPSVFAAELGFAVALGVLLDTVVVRSVLVTALTLDIGRRIWWPSTLASRRETVEPSGEAELALTGG